MTTLVTGVELLREIEKMCSRDEDIYFAVSYWSGGAAERIKGFAKGQLHVVLDIHSGGTSPRDLKVLMEWLGDRVKVHPDLHAKIYASDTHALLGSANATSPGLQIRETGRVEAVLKIESQDAREIFDFAKRQYNAGRPATDEDVRTCERLFGRVTISQSESVPVEALGLVDALYLQPDLYAHLPLIVTVKEVDDELVDAEWQAEGENLAGAGWAPEFSIRSWDNFSFPLDEEYIEKVCLALHIGPRETVYAGLIWPFRSQRSEWTFARRVQWSEVPGLSYPGRAAQSLGRGLDGDTVREDRLARIKEAIWELEARDERFLRANQLIDLIAPIG